MERDVCGRQLLARGPFALIEQCSCGAVHLTIGAVTLRLAPEALAELAQVVGDAACELAMHDVLSTIQPGVRAAAS